MRALRSHNSPQRGSLATSARPMTVNTASGCFLPFTWIRSISMVANLSWAFSAVREPMTMERR
jgi:hypothetical protein